MAFFEGADWIAIVTLAGGTAAGLVGAWLTHRRPPKEDDDREGGRLVVVLHDDDRELLNEIKIELLKLKDALFRGASRVEDACQQLRHAINDLAEQIKRNRKD